MSFALCCHSVIVYSPIIMQNCVSFNFLPTDRNIRATLFEISLRGSNLISTCANGFSIFLTRRNVPLCLRYRNGTVTVSQRRHEVLRSCAHRHFMRLTAADFWLLFGRETRSRSKLALVLFSPKFAFHLRIKSALSLSFLLCSPFFLSLFLCHRCAQDRLISDPRRALQFRGERLALALAPNNTRRYNRPPRVAQFYRALTGLKAPRAVLSKR